MIRSQAGMELWGSTNTRSQFWAPGLWCSHHSFADFSTKKKMTQTAVGSKTGCWSLFDLNTVELQFSNGGTNFARNSYLTQRSKVCSCCCCYWLKQQPLNLRLHTDALLTIYSSEIYHFIVIKRQTDTHTQYSIRLVQIQFRFFPGSEAIF